ncbi:MAG: metallophosphoesterase [Hyphomonas sp.]|nr:metallophosphoesterase [Hyphomonas sp.]
MQYKVFGRDKDATPQSTKGRQIIERLRAGELPQMVDWFDPHLLAKVGVRSILSSTIGSYTDQRLIQAATDPATEDELKTRYDYSGSGQPSSALRPDASGAVWVDYIADLGDGFEPTYAMAYLMAEDRLKVEGSDEPLPGGSLLVMGGDQVYPDANKHEYQTRLQDPYDWAFSSDVPQRKLFAIPGNHDWYDGLSSFSALFCSARDRISKGLGTQIGGWRCHQHRSYFAIKLPHDWWIWGPDIQLADNLDDSQRDYFDLMADQTKPGDKIILCIAEPSWLHQNYDNLHEISMLARKNGACIMAVLAGDWHHYSRYTCDRLGVQFITCGGGGAFAHATHGLRRRISLNWASLTGAPHRVSDPSDPEEFNRMERSVIGPEGPDFSLNVGVDAREPERTIPPIPFISGGGPAGAMQDAAVKLARWKSRLLCLHNLVLPFRNQKFAMLVGIIYFVFAWVWSSSDPRHSPVMTKLAEDIAVQAQHARTEYDNIRSAITNLQNRLMDLEKASAGKPQTTEMVVLEQQLASARALLPAIQPAGRSPQSDRAAGRMSARPPLCIHDARPVGPPRELCRYTPRLGRIVREVYDRNNPLCRARRRASRHKLDRQRRRRPALHGAQVSHARPLARHHPGDLELRDHPSPRRPDRRIRDGPILDAHVDAFEHAHGRRVRRARH